MLIRALWQQDFSKERYARERLASGLNQYSDQPWFLHPSYLAGVRPETAAFFRERFCALYQSM